jgi:hypothetical protein
MVDGHQAGGSFASGLLSSVQDASKNTALGDVPGYVTDSPHEAGLDDGGIVHAAAQAAQTNEAATYVSEHSKERQVFKLDTDTDSMFINANTAISDPEKTLETVVIERYKEGGKGEEISCLEGGEEYIKTCKKTRVVEIEIIPEKRAPGKCGGHSGAGISNKNKDSPGNKSWCPPGRGCNAGKITQHRKINIIKDEWVDGCITLEKKSDDGFCVYEDVSRGGKETRAIEGPVVNPEAGKPTTDVEPITRNSWEETYTYRCSKKTGSECEALRGRGCVQINSKCEKNVGEMCVLWKQTYRCPDKPGKKFYKLQGGKPIFCFTGDCTERELEANGELAEALSHLTILKEAQDDIRANLGIFKGQGRQCSKNCVGFRDCCTTGNGWGVSLHLSNCSGEEKELAQWREKKRCTLIGTYCAEKHLGICTRKKTSFCCFGTKLARLINTQGRQQLGIGWGELKNPDCRGLTPEELSRLDFSKMDLRELFEDVYAKFNPPTQDHMAKGLELERIKENMKHLAKNKTDNLGLKKEQDLKLMKEYQTKKVELEQKHEQVTQTLHQEFQASLNPKTALYYKIADNPDGGGFYTGTTQLTPACLAKYTRLTPQEVIAQAESDLSVNDYGQLEPKTDMRAVWSGNYAAAANWRASNLKIVHGKIREFKAAAETALEKEASNKQEQKRELLELHKIITDIEPELLKEGEAQ